MLNTICPFCGKHFEGSTRINGEEEPPKNGDITLCIGCGEWAIFDGLAFGGLRRPSHAEYERIVSDPLTAKAREAWTRMKTEKAKPRPPVEERYRLLTDPDRTLDEQFEMACEFLFMSPPPDRVREPLKRMFLTGAMVFGHRLVHIARVNQDPLHAAKELDRLIDEIGDSALDALK
jgi:hypothetical protein